MEFLLLIQQLLQPIRQYDVRIIEPAILFVELVILINLLFHGASLADSLNSKVLQILKILTLKRSAGPSLAGFFSAHLSILIEPGVLRWNSAY